MADSQQTSAEDAAATAAAAAATDEARESEKLKTSVKTKHDTKKRRLRKRLSETLGEGESDYQKAHSMVGDRARTSRGDVRDGGETGEGDQPGAAPADAEAAAAATAAPADSKSKKPSKMSAKALRRQKLQEEERLAEARRRQEAEEAQLTMAGGATLSREERLTRFDTATAQELKQSKADRMAKFAKMSWDTLREKKDLTEEEQVSFFANIVWEDEDAEPTDAAAAADDVGAAGETDDDVLVLEGESIYLHRAIVEQPPDESELYFYPSTNAEPIVTVEQPVDPADEGLYVGRRPRVAEGNLLRLQNVLTVKADVYETKKEWIGIDGQLRILPNPLRDVPIRPLVFAEDQEDVAQQPVQLQREFRPARRWDSPFANLERETPWQLEVDIGSVQFLAHPLFTPEHAAVSRLRQLYARYVKLEKGNFLAYFRDRIAAMRRAIVSLEAEIARQELSQHGNERVVRDCRARVEVYRSELETSRRSKIGVESQHYNLLIELIEAWHEVRRIRREAGYSVTDIRCDIEETVQSKSEDEQDMQKELAEWTEEHDAVVTARNQRRKEAFERERRAYEQQLAESETARQRMEQSGLATDEFQEPPQPLEPQLESVEEFVQQIERLVRRGEDEHGQVAWRRRQPGEPRVRFRLLDNSNVPTTLDQMPAARRLAEEQRRNKMESVFSYYFRIYVDDKLVGPTDSVTLSSNFVLNFNRVHLVEVVQPPTRLRLALVECQTGRFRSQSKVIGHVTLPRPDSQTTRMQVNMSELRFSHQAGAGTEATGAAPAAAAAPPPAAAAAATFQAVVRARCGWGCDPDGNILAPVRKVYDPQSESYVDDPDDLARNKPIRLTELKDPNDPACVRINYHGVLGEDPDAAAKADLAGYCRLNAFEDEFDFCGQADIEGDPRFRAICMRDRGELGPEQMKGAPMPALSGLVNKKWLEDKKHEKEAVKARASRFEKMRHDYLTKMRYVREQVLEAFNTAKGYRSYDDVINEAKAYMVDFLSLLRPLCSRKRPLKPPREESSYASVQALAVTPLSLSVNIIGAAHLPRPNDKSLPLRPFVEATFQGNSVRTVSVQGSSPEWGAQLELPFRLKNASQKPETIDEPLVLNVFNDTTYQRPSESGQELSSVVVQEKHFLGNLSIPFSTVYVNEKVTGRLALRVPDLLMGYTSVADTAKPAAAAAEAAAGSAEPEGGAPTGRRKGGHRRPALRVFISLQPHLARPNVVQQTFDTAHQADRQWVYAKKQELARIVDQVLQERAKRQADPEKQADEFLYNPRAFVVSMEVKEVFVSCYLNEAGMPPPQELFRRGEREVTDVELRKMIAARYVSLIPFVSDASAFPGLIDLWNTCEEFLEYQAGDEEEHAVLLANYLTHMTANDANTHIYLALGNAVPEGATAYVVEQSNNEWFAWNPSQGTRFDVQSKECPLVSVDCLISAESVYVNKKPFEGTNALRNNAVNEQSSWHMIGKPNQSSFECIQQEIDYASDAIMASEIGNIEFEIESAVRHGIEGWRARVPTLWYNGGSKDVRDLLKAMETFHYDHRCQEIARAKDNYNRSFGSKVIVGYPMQMSYRPIQEILQEVKNTKIHEMGMYVDSKEPMPKVQFSCVVYVHQYPKNVLSIWVNLMALKK